MMNNKLDKVESPLDTSSVEKQSLDIESSPSDGSASPDSRWVEVGLPVSSQGARADLDDLTETLTRRSTHKQDQDSDDFDLGAFLRQGILERRATAGDSAKKVGVIFKNLTVKGVDSSRAYVRTLPDAVLGSLGLDLYHYLQRAVLKISGKTPPTRDILRDFTGVVRDGEMMLVLGRPGAGCSTFLKAISNQRESFALVDGEVSYGGIPAREQQKSMRGEVVYNPEDDQHFPLLSVWQTLSFSLATKTRIGEKHAIQTIGDTLLKMFGISHTKDTVVGDEYVRGISGGERKRVSIAETLVTKAAVTCWDNSTRGLDASTALDYAESLRVMTDVSHRTTLVALNQASESLYDLMDKVILIEDGRMIFQGPANAAKEYFTNLGYLCPNRETTADFLTSVGDPNIRQFRPGCEKSAPKTPEELEAAFRKSEDYQSLLQDISSFEKELEDSNFAKAERFRRAVHTSKSKRVPKKSSYTVSYYRQVLICTKREAWLLFADTESLYSKFFIIISVGLLLGSLFYEESLDTGGAYSRGGAAFVSATFLGWLQLGELMKAVSGRAIISRHKDYAFYRPSAVALGRVLVDFPLLLVQVIVFGLIMYWMSNFDADAGKFFIYLLFLYSTTISLTALYRMFAAISPTVDDALRFAGLALNLLLIFGGYVIPKTQLMSGSIWFGWLYYVNPMAYAFEALMTNDFSGRVMQCSEENLVPRGQGALPGFQGCSLPGSQLGQTKVTGAAYLQASFQYSRSNLWRNFGLILVLTAAYILVTVLGTEFLTFVKKGGEALVFKRPLRKKQTPEPVDDVEKQATATSTPAEPEKSTSQSVLPKPEHERAFAWSNVEYTVPTKNGERKLLQGVSGYVKSGVMVALVGASGAGKTTLLNTLSQRQKIGVVSGDLTLDGKPLGLDFRRQMGFVEQMDIHDNTATVREALEFSAILRQGREIPLPEKMDSVDEVIELLELQQIQNAIISSLGVEQKKRLTIGVELAAKPEMLLFLDEPTSGLDSQSAMSVVRFLRKLTRAGQAIICTIHQPSSRLMEQFDMVLALNPGGNTFYFGPFGENGATVIDYFKQRGATCPPSKNVAEFILETAAKQASKNKRVDWVKECKNSEQNKQVLEEITAINAQKVDSSSYQRAVKSTYAASTYKQCVMLTKRLFVQYWRDPSYLYGKLFVSVMIGIFNGFTFWNLGNSVISLQDRMFSLFLIILIPPVVMNGILPRFFQNRDLWEARELPSRTYGWVAFCTANIVAEIPPAVVTGTVYWALWYFAAGNPTDAASSGYVFLMTILFYLFQTSWGQWICAFAPSFTVISNILPFFFVMVNLFNGVFRPYSSLAPIWRYFMYYVNPVTWWIRGVLSATTPSIKVVCSSVELTYFNPPSGQNCAQYTRNFIENVAQAGYLQNPDATSNCGYCPYANGAEYIKTLNVQDGDKWRCFGIFLAFCIINWILVYFFIYTVRIRGWSFGFGPIINAVSRGVRSSSSIFRRKGKSTADDGI